MNLQLNARGRKCSVGTSVGATSSRWFLGACRLGTDDATVVARHPADSFSDEEPRHAAVAIDRRVKILEDKVESLERLPARIDHLELQILQFREDVRAEFSATRAEFLARIALTETALLHEMHQLDERRGHETRRELAETRTELIARIAEGDEETRRYMRVLHEEVIARIATIGEGRRRE